MGQEGKWVWGTREGPQLGIWSTLLVQGQAAKGLSMAGSQNLNRPRAWGWHLVHVRGTGLAGPSGETRVKSAREASQTPQPPPTKGRKLHADHTAWVNGSEGLKAPSLGRRGGHRPGLPPAFPLADGRCRAGVGRERQNAEEPAGWRVCRDRCLHGQAVGLRGAIPGRHGQVSGMANSAA